MSYRPSIIKSIQRGTINLKGSLSADATIAAVMMANTELHGLGTSSTDSSGTNGNSGFSGARLALTSPTTVNATRGANNAVYDVIIGFVVVEYFPGVLKSLQRGVFALPASGTGTVTLAPVTLTKAREAYLGWSGGYNAWAPIYQPRLTLTNPTTLSIAMTASLGITVDVSWQVAEFR